MGKKIIFTALFALTTILAQAQQIKVEYENKISSLPELIQQYFEMQKVQHSRLMIKGNFNGKRAKIGKVICDKGSFIEREMLADYVHFILVDSIETLDFMAIPTERTAYVFLVSIHPITTVSFSMIQYA